MYIPLSHLLDHKFKHNFQDILNLLCIYLTNESSTLLNSIKDIGPTNLTKSDSIITNFFSLTISVYSKNEY